MNITEADLADIIAWGQRHSEIRAIYLYGSRARGDNHANSDIDLAVRLFLKPGDGSTLATWIFWKHEWDMNPDLTLSNRVHLEWYEVDQNLQRVGTGVEKDGILLFSRD